MQFNFKMAHCLTGKHLLLLISTCQTDLTNALLVIHFNYAARLWFIIFNSFSHWNKKVEQVVATKEENGNNIAESDRWV